MRQTLPDGRRLILASTSPYRQDLLGRLELPFETAAPGTDESARPGEAPQELVRRLAECKARAVAEREPGALVIGSDQVAVLGGAIVGKPCDHAQAAAQLARASGRAVEFLTGVAVIDGDSGRTRVDAVSYRVHFRVLDADLIERYLAREKPYHCAGAIRSEALGICLFDRMEGDDPTGLVGLPLIRLTRMLEAEGVAVL